jgi:hypothetical protein
MDKELFYEPSNYAAIEAGMINDEKELEELMSREHDPEEERELKDRIAKKSYIWMDHQYMRRPEDM